MRQTLPYGRGSAEVTGPSGRDACGPIRTAGEGLRFHTGFRGDLCRDELEEVLEEWLLYRLSRQLPVPIADGIDLVAREVARCRESDRSGG